LPTLRSWIGSLALAMTEPSIMSFNNPVLT
jgi:hypothetical protein